ncbi:hypothetical protein D4764_11G0000070 [Takifugu flavidus]|uniref:Uncharacterized protein n=1 Tax=Takifugu flavidus TaxID=433684 RepID=A0A5C6PFW9_9TELE|nr:hypothetical protein D4764_11G0000070 [Takifugu flavidus]
MHEEELMGHSTLDDQRRDAEGLPVPGLSTHLCDERCDSTCGHAGDSSHLIVLLIGTVASLTTLSPSLGPSPNPGSSLCFLSLLMFEAGNF